MIIINMANILGEEKKNKSKPNFATELDRLKKPIWSRIEHYLPNKSPSEYYAAVNEYPRRQGKYFRPALVVLATEMFGGNINDSYLTAAAMQMSEEWLLVHDDFLDNSEERRSTKEECRPSLNKIYGDEIAVNAGDTLHALMWKIVGDSVRELGDERGWRVYKKINDIILTTLEGQYMELAWNRDRKIDITENEYYEMIYIKAGYYTVTGPSQLGGIIAGISDKDLDSVREWGISFGCSFQIWDDVMNLTINADISGKEKGGDILEGKRTLSLIHLLRSCSAVEKEYIKTVYAKKREEKTNAEVQHILTLMERYGCIEYAIKQAKDFSNKALKVFDNQVSRRLNGNAADIIREGIKFVVNRSR